MRLRITRYDGGWRYAVSYRGETFTGYGLTKQAAWAGSLIAVYSLRMAS